MRPATRHFSSSTSATSAAAIDEHRLLLRRHLHRLHSATGIRPVVDTSSPVSMFASPKSIHYRPFPVPHTKRRPHSADDHLLRAKNRAVATNKPASDGDAERSRPTSAYSLRLAAIESKVTQSRNYQPPSTGRRSRQEGLKMGGGGVVIIPSSGDTGGLDELPPYPSIGGGADPKGIHWFSSLEDNNSNKRMTNASQPPPAIRGGRPSAYKGRVTYDGAPRMSAFNQSEDTTVLPPEYRRFKDEVLSQILLRGIFTDRVIEDTFLRQINKSSSRLDKAILHHIMRQSLAELNVNSSKGSTHLRLATTTSTPHPKGDSLPPTSPSSSGISSTPSAAPDKLEGSIASSAANTNASKSNSSGSESEGEEEDNGADVVPLGARPPLRLSTSSSADLDDLAKRLSTKHLTRQKKSN